MLAEIEGQALGGAITPAHTGFIQTPVVTAVAVALGIHLFVLFYEEPTLRVKFGADYEEYLPELESVVATPARLGQVTGLSETGRMNTFFARLWTEQLDHVPAGDGKRLLGSDSGRLLGNRP